MSASSGKNCWKIARRAAQPMRNPPPSNMPLTPNDPKLSTLPYPLGNRSEGGFRDHDTVASVMISLTRSVRLWMASAIRAVCY